MGDNGLKKSSINKNLLQEVSRLFKRGKHPMDDSKKNYRQCYSQDIK